jgi:hypothetical protein
LSNNQISDFTEVLTWLRHIREQLSWANFASNKIRTIPDEINGFVNLEKLNLEINEIETTLTSRTFQNLSKLNALTLFNNRLDCSSDAFAFNQRLAEHELFNNRLTNLPELTTSTRTLNCRNQNGNLRELRDFQFDVNATSSSNDLKVDISNNPSLTRFGSKLFCSRTNRLLKRLYDLSVDVEAASRFEKCLWRQLGLRNQLQPAI